MAREVVMVDYGRFTVDTWRERTNQATEARQRRIKEARATIQRRVDDRQTMEDFRTSLKDLYQQAAKTTDLASFLRSLYEGKGGAYDNTG